MNTTQRWKIKKMSHQDDEQNNVEQRQRNHKKKNLNPR